MSEMRKGAGGGRASGIGRSSSKGETQYLRMRRLEGRMSRLEREVRALKQLPPPTTPEERSERRRFFSVTLQEVKDLIVQLSRMFRA